MSNARIHRQNHRQNRAGTPALTVDDGGKACDDRVKQRGEVGAGADRAEGRARRGASSSGLANEYRHDKQRSYELLQRGPGCRVLDLGCGPATDTISPAVLVG